MGWKLTSGERGNVVAFDAVVASGEKLRVFATSVDGSLLDEPTWRSRHRLISRWGWTLTAATLVITLIQRSGGGEWLFAPLLASFVALASVKRLGRRPRELAITAAFAFAQIFISRYIGNLFLGPIDVIILTFYQDWVPIAAACCAAILLVILAAIDPSFYSANVAFQREVPIVGMIYRSSVVIGAAALALVVWRSGTQLARDQLTGLLSRAGAERVLDREIARGHCPAVWVCDIDNFKMVNAELGSDAGDRLLRHVASQLQRVAQSLPSACSCSRLGGDTFLIALHHQADQATLRSFAERIEAQATVPAIGLAAHDIPVRLSIGAATSLPGESTQALLLVATRSMREAKSRGHSRVVVNQRNDRNSIPAGGLLIAELYRACERDELELHFQPIVTLTDGRPVGAEALVRWNHPDRGLVWPGSFLPTAERDSALMALITDTLFRDFLHITTSLRERNGRDWLPYGFSFNLAPICLHDPTLTASMTAHLTSAGMVNAERLIELEVTEGALLDLEEGAPEILAALRNLGFRIALDDFGTGYSSLAQLPNLPLDTVKIDKSFVAGMERSPTDLAVVQAVADIASSAQLQIVAEGIETPAQRDQLLTVRPEILAQGWLYSRSLPLTDFETWVTERQLALHHLEA